MKKLVPFLSEHIISAAIITLWVKTVLITFICFDLTLVSWLDLVSVVIAPIGILMLFIGLSFYFTRKINYWILFTVMVLATATLYANMLYYRFYIDFVTAGVLMQAGKVGGIGYSTFVLLSPFDSLLIVDLIFFGWIFLQMKKQKQLQKRVPIVKSYLLAAITFMLVTFGAGLAQHPHLFNTQYDRQQLVTTLGIHNYQWLNLIYDLSSPIQEAFSEKPDTKTVQTYFNDKQTNPTNLFGAAKGKNVVLISLESTQNFVINQTVNGEEITPFLNGLIDKSFYFSSIYHQTAQGKTSDAEFLIDTGLYPLPSGTVFVRKSNNTYHSLPKILDTAAGYTSASFHGNVRTFYNRNVMYDTLGYDRFFSKRDYDVTDENSVNYGLKDIPFFEQSIDKLASLEEPYYAKFLTLTNHFPFLLEKEDQMIEPPETDEEIVNRYITTVRYEDEAVKRFFQLLKDRGMYEDTIFVLYGDHYGIPEEYESGVNQLLGQKNTPVNHMKLQQIPLIIHMPGEEGRQINAVGGQIDIRATLLHLLGIKTDDKLSFSQDLFTRNNTPVIFRNGDMLTNDYLYTDNRCYNINSEKQVSRNHCLAYSETVRKHLELNDEIILGDLLRFLE